MPGTSSRRSAADAVPFRGMAEEVLAALGDSFRGNRLTAAVLGVAATLVVALSLAVVAASLSQENALGEASLAGIIAGLVTHAGLLLTYAAVSRIAAVEREGEAITNGAAFGFALARVHIVVGVPLFVLLVALGLGMLGVRVAFAAGESDAAGAGLGTVSLVVVFVVNLMLVVVLLVSHVLTAPSAACTEEGFSFVGARLVRIFQERLGDALAYQAVALSAVLPLVLLTGAAFFAAFQPPFYAVASGRLRALASEAPAPTPAAPLGAPTPAGPGSASPKNLSTRAEEWASNTVAAGGAALLAVALLIGLLLVSVPLVFLAGAETAAYIGLTGDHCRMTVTEAQADERPAPAAAGPRRPPIVHCWRCDAISRYESGVCAKCGAGLDVCPHCFATNEVGRETCSSCGEALEPADAEPEAVSLTRL